MLLCFIVLCCFQVISADRVRRAAIYTMSNSWMDDTIPYTFLYWKSGTKTADLQKIRSGMKTWSSATCVKFQELASHELHMPHVRFMNAQFCSSKVGRQVGDGADTVQHIYLAKSHQCLWRGTILHELGHLIGLVHEHQRPDRDEHVRVDTSGMLDAEADNFDIYEDVNAYETPYDPLSVMHYETTVFQTHPNRPTLHLEKFNDSYHTGEVFWKDLSFNDAKVVNTHYKCSKNCPEFLSCPEDSYMDKNCECIDRWSFNENRCHDDWSECSRRKSFHQCETNSGQMYIHCRRNCGWCHRFPPIKSTISETTENCRDRVKEVVCRRWARYGECLRNKRFMYSKCASTCGRCHLMRKLADSVIDSHNCTDTGDVMDCDSWAATGECSRNSDWMHKFCARSCDLCILHTTTVTTPVSSSSASSSTSSSSMDTRCIDRRRHSCSYWADIGACGRNRYWMRANCAFSCGYCFKIVNTSRCADKSTQCVNWSGQGRCGEHWVAAECPHTCDLCDKNSPTTSVSISISSTQSSRTTSKSRPVHIVSTHDVRALCVNKYKKSHKKCEIWGKKGYCTHPRYGPRLRKICGRTCRPECRNSCRNQYYIDRNCDAWALQGMCKNNEWVRGACAQTCRTCPRGLCEDLIPSDHCPKYCQTLDQFRNCPRSCGLCERRCADAVSYCDGLREANWCELHTRTTIRACIKTCGLC